MSERAIVNNLVILVVGILLLCISVPIGAMGVGLNLADLIILIPLNFVVAYVLTLILTWVWLYSLAKIRIIPQHVPGLVVRVWLLRGSLIGVAFVLILLCTIVVCITPMFKNILLSLLQGFGISFAAGGTANLLLTNYTSRH